MIIRTLFALLFAAIAFGTGQAALAEDAFTPRPAKLFFDKPQLDNYADYNDFLVDIMEYRRQREAFGAPLDGPSDKPTTRPARPETLQEALQKAGRYASPPGIVFERYGRTTPDSMPLPALTGTGLAEQGITGVLQDMNSIDPQTYSDDTAQAQAEELLADRPSNDQETRDKKAREDDQDISQVAYDPDARLLTDSYGTTRRPPVYVPNEIGYTVIRTFDIAVDILK